MRHPSFACPGYLGLARAYGVATVVAQSPDGPCIADRTAGTPGDVFVYFISGAKARNGMPGNAE